MTTPITIEQYFGPHGDHAAITEEMRESAEALLDNVNDVLRLAAADGVELQANPVTGSMISGSGNGGWRPPESPVGASKSTHKRAMGIDIYDPARALARWCSQNVSRLQMRGILAMEDPRWTPTWAHMQTVAVPSGRFFFIPNSSPPLAPPL